jgi:two-component system, chemotaxis family, chemotaxis protein CheY
MTGPSARLAAGSRALNILIVDDSTVVRTMIKRVAGLCEVPIANVYEASDGLEAIRVLEIHPMDCVLTGINMPVMSGIGLLREMEKRENWQRVIRVIVSTDGSTARRQEARDLNVRLYVEKPFRPEVMRDVLTEITASADLR